MAQQPIDVDAILASLDPALADPGEDPWGGANLEPAGTDLAGIQTERRRYHDLDDVLTEAGIDPDSLDDED